ncbi:MAG: nucleotidyl transferase AbiEii/AbiGii toxin family protein [Halofilum sp. (in: g-proteobacteria)]|nr:nucleotidyl transferase AbiEii/AbiGii toxin family protein [Halofilum sp. (in: g-proteobacteria)]
MDELREQFLERLTAALFRKRGEGFVLKGGGAMRARFGNERMTKDLDLDFTNPKRSADSLHKSVRHAIDQAARGLSVSDLRVHEPGKGEASPRWKVNFRDDAGHPVHVEIEVSRDPTRAVPGRVVQHRYQPLPGHGTTRFWVDVYDDATLAATKLAALLGRGAPRDVYDLDLLMGAGEPPSAEQVGWAVRRAGADGREPVELLWAQLDGLVVGAISRRAARCPARRGRRAHRRRRVGSDEAPRRRVRPGTAGTCGRGGSMKPWQIRLQRTLARPDAPPVLTRDLLSRFARSARDGEPVPASSLSHWIRGAVAEDRLRPVQRGLYLNAFRAHPGGRPTPPAGSSPMRSYR